MKGNIKGEMEPILRDVWFVLSKYEELQEEVGCDYEELRERIEEKPEWKPLYTLLEIFREAFFKGMDLTFSKEEQEIYVSNLNRMYKGG